MTAQPTRAASKDSAMYGLPDMEAFVTDIKASITYGTAGAAMCVMGLMSDAQEQMALGQLEAARQTLNRAKYLMSRLAVAEESAPDTGTPPVDKPGPATAVTAGREACLPPAPSGEMLLVLQDALHGGFENEMDLWSAIRKAALAAQNPDREGGKCPS